MMYIGFLVDFAEISKSLSVNCGLYFYRDETTIFEILTQSPTLNFSFLYLVRGLLYRSERKSVFLTSLGNFPIDLLTRQFNVDLICGNL